MLLIDEAHLFMPKGYDTSLTSIFRESTGFFMIVPDLDHITDEVFSFLDVVIIMGTSAERSIKWIARKKKFEPPEVEYGNPGDNQALVWKFKTNDLVKIDIIKGSTPHKRHTRQYSEGDLGMERSFYFRSPEGKLNLRAQNLGLFIQLAQGIDDSTWRFHLERGDFSKWFMEVIHDKELAETVKKIETMQNISIAESRDFVISGIKERHIIADSLSQTRHPIASS